MTIAQSPPNLSKPSHSPRPDDLPESLPDHRQLPESDGSIVKNFQEHPQSVLLTSSILRKLDELHPDGNYAIGQDSGIYWGLTDPVERGVEAPDWFYVPNVPPLLDGERRRSYVMWKEIVSPLIAIEFTSGDGSEERDYTSPFTSSGSSSGKKAGKMWAYEQGAKISFYAIYEVEKASVEVYQLIGGRYQRCSPNNRGHFPIHPMGVELGIWQGTFLSQEFPWLRWWDVEGNLLLTGDEQVLIEQQRTLEEQQRADEADRKAQEATRKAQEADRKLEEATEQAEAERLRSIVLATKLRELGIDPDTL